MIHPKFSSYFFFELEASKAEVKKDKQKVVTLNRDNKVKFGIFILENKEYEQDSHTKKKKPKTTEGLYTEWTQSLLKRCFRIWPEWEEMFTCARAKGRRKLRKNVQNYVCL